MKKHKFKAWIQIILLVLGIFAFAYILKEIKSGEIVIVKKKSMILNVLPTVFKILVKSIFNERTLVSALEPSDLQLGTATCPVSKDGSICQEYASSECGSKCNGECFPATRDNVPNCKIGTCFDPNIGTCQERSSRASCTENGGKWFDDVAGNIIECQKACCVLGEDVAPLVTVTECDYIERTSGINTEYKPEIRNELLCLALVRSKVEGACVFEGIERACKFLTKEECLKNSGEFHEGLLCTNPDLGFDYKKQATARCVEGKDEIYWFDSAGNRENIYDANKAKSWNGGKVLTESESCSLGDNLKNQKTCGNCNALRGSVCGQKTSNEKLSDNSIDFVCRDLRCKDNDGSIRENGESWCEYQGAVGIDKGSGGLTRSVDTPGSRHFRTTCIDGEIQIDPCADYRNAVCVEERTKRDDGKELSSAACVTNLWQLCINYNSEVKGDTKQARADAMVKRDEKCMENPHCELKKINIDKGFKFNVCVPKYSPGFDLQKNAEGGELSCGFANQKCTVIYVKEISGWKCKANCDCEKKEFAEQMNDLCMSLGDCGASANYLGDLTENYKVRKSPPLNEKYLNEIKEYSETVPGQFIKAGDVSAYYKAIGASGKAGQAGFENPTPEGLSSAGTIAGLTGTVLLFAANTEVPSVLSALEPVLTAPSVVAAGAILAGAAIGFAVTALLIQYTGIAAGLDPAITWGLIATGTLSGALLGASYAGYSGLITSFAVAAIPLLIIGLILLLVVVILIVVFAALGVGDVKKKVVTFECKPWQAPFGGTNCEKCGSDGYPCSKYACQSLGQTCRLINEGTGEEKCVDISPNDVTAPIIKPWKDVLTKGFRYEDVSDAGMKIVSGDNDGCIKSYENLIFGISVNEPAYCKFDYQNKNNFDEMEFDFGGRNLFLENHSQFFTLPDITSLGVPGYDPTRRADLNLYVRCIDGNGNGKDFREFAINFCIKPGDDKTPPVITGREPLNEFTRFDQTELDGKVFTNEPASCKWSLADKKYGEMENNMECENDLVDRDSLLGWSCNSAFNIDKEENKFYVRCKDQPWYGENWQGESSDTITINESKRNEMKESYVFIVKRTKTPLKIDSVKPNNETLIFGVEPATVELEVETSGGVDGRATCNLFGSPMGETFGTTHKQLFNRIFAGDYEFTVNCIDTAGNTAEAVSRFKVELDVSPPTVTRVYRDGRSLIIVTEEESECAFVNDNKLGCGFDFVNGTLMSGAGQSHSISLDTRDNYYIKCKDKWGNTPGECNVVVREGDYG